MKRLISVLLLLCLLACVPTPEQEVVVNKGDDIAGEIIRETPRTDADTQQSVVPFPAHWTDEIHTKDADMRIDADVIAASQSSHPVYGISRTSFFEMDLQRVFDAFFPSMQAYLVGIRQSKEDYEQAIAYVVEKSEEHAQELFSQFNAADLTDAAFIQSDHLDLRAQESNHMFTILCTNGEKGTFFSTPAILEINRHAWSSIQAKEFVERTGAYAGETNAIVCASLSLDEAKSKADAFFEKMEIDGFALCKSEEARLFDSLGYRTWSNGWHLQFCRSGGYVPFQAREFDSSHNGFFTFDADEESYAAGWPYEWIDLYVSEQGIEFFKWVNPLKVTGIVNENVSLLPFDELTAVIRRTLQAAMHYPVHMFGWFKLEKLILTAAPQPKKDAADAYLMPIWICVIRCYMTDEFGNEDAESILLTVGFNAVDGTRVDLSAA